MTPEQMGSICFQLLFDEGFSRKSISSSEQRKSLESDSDVWALHFMSRMANEQFEGSNFIQGTLESYGLQAGYHVRISSVGNQLPCCRNNPNTHSSHGESSVTAFEGCILRAGQQKR